MNRPDSVTIPFLLLLLVIVPAIAVRGWFRLRSGNPLPPKRRRYIAAIIWLVFLGELAFLAAPQRVGAFFALPEAPAWICLAAAAAITAYLALLAFRFRRGWPRLNSERKDRLRRLVPENPSEMVYWVPVSLLAGVSEEFAYRGVGYAGLVAITGSPLASLILCVAAFGAAHITQGWRGAMGSAVLALLFHLTVFLTGTIFVAVIFHAAYDLLIGFLSMRAFIRDASAKNEALPATS